MNIIVLQHAEAEHLGIFLISRSGRAQLEDVSPISWSPAPVYGGL